jgi:hypothetical protein
MYKVHTQKESITKAQEKDTIFSGDDSVYGRRIE